MAASTVLSISERTAVYVLVLMQLLPWSQKQVSAVPLSGFKSDLTAGTAGTAPGAADDNVTVPTDDDV
jgi:hypothetical protein